MIQTMMQKIYGILEKLFGGKHRNGRKFSLCLLTVLLFFICAIFVPDSKAFLCDSVWVGGIVAVVGAYSASNVANKLAGGRREKPENGESG